MARPRKPLPKTFVHFRANEQLTSALDDVADAQNITRSEVARIILELYLFNDVNRVAMYEGLGKVHGVVKVATARAFIAFKQEFERALNDTQQQRALRQVMRPNAFESDEEEVLD